MKRAIPLVGAIVCSVACAGSPVVVGALSAVGLSFLRNDWLLVPLEIASIGLVIRGLPRTREIAAFGGSALLIGMYQSGVSAAVLIGLGAAFLLAAMLKK
jgi:hypothetical protein